MWIDIVFSGGGVKGFAFVGALSKLEESGYRFKRAAGTSAGAIVAALLASGYPAAEMKTLMDGLNTRQLLDSRTKISLPFLKWLRVYYKMGLYRGDSLEKWLIDALAAKGVHTFSDLPPDALKIIAADVTRGRMVVMPDDLKEYGIEPAVFSIARAVRMSAGLPFFFEPVSLFDNSGERSLIVDGGLLSNFPLWVFDKGEELPERPFIGLQTTNQLNGYHPVKINNAVELFRGLFSTMREAHDEKTIQKLRDSNIIVIPIDKVQTKDFDISLEERDRLFALGRDETDLFLKKWSF
ncbi:MAG: patatin-like phospholipase family protein [Sporolactobacillus sp.]